DPRVKEPEKLFAPRDINWETEGSHWAFQAPKPQVVPTPANAAWAWTDIDRFILAKQEANGLTPARDAAKATWLRRVTVDLTGLPPTPGELLDFDLDGSPKAKEKVVDRLLNSPRFGERWARHWLDVSRYGESTGKERNFVYLQAWRYRDYVIDSLNQDKPFDKFVREQVAGDLLPHANDAERDLHQIATGFLTLNPKGINDRNRESFLLEIVDEQIESVSRGLMAVSVVCARCHDHKYDPVPQADYYKLAGIFRSSEPRFGILNRTRNASVPEQLIPLASAETRQGVEIPHALIAELKIRNEAVQAKQIEARRLRDVVPRRRFRITARRTPNRKPRRNGSSSNWKRNSRRKTNWWTICGPRSRRTWRRPWRLAWWNVPIPPTSRFVFGARSTKSVRSSLAASCRC
ncbi:MAG: DUF1549 domain-containing protein, partial [Planctomycetota bacterium]|nr:DUF1549 domain-containing protein [Planctomycetota bacterium]